MPTIYGGTQDLSQDFQGRQKIERVWFRIRLTWSESYNFSGGRWAGPPIAVHNERAPCDYGLVRHFPSVHCEEGLLTEFETHGVKYGWYSAEVTVKRRPNYIANRIAIC